MVSIPDEIQAQLKKANREQVFRATCTSVHDTAAGGFTVGIQRAGQQNPDSVEYRYLGPAPAVGDDVLVFRVGDGYIVAGIDETTLDRQTEQVVINNTAAEVTLYEFVVPANTMTLVRGLHFYTLFTWIDTAGLLSVTYRVKLNGTVVRTLGPISMLSVEVANQIDLMILNRGALNSQFSFEIEGTSPILSAEDSSQPITLSFTAQMSGAAATATVRREYILLERR